MTYKISLLALVFCVGITVNTTEVQAHGTVNGGHCYNGWHLKNGKCHKPHSTKDKRYIKNGGKCYNGWFLDTETGKCVKSRGIWGWLTD
jgi:hypothetical protein